MFIQMCSFSIVFAFGDLKQHVSMPFMQLLFFRGRGLLVASAEASTVFRQQMARARSIAIYARYNG